MARVAWQRLHSSSDFVPYRCFPRAFPLLVYSVCSARQEIEGHVRVENSRVELAGVLVLLVEELLQGGMMVEFVLGEPMVEQQSVVAKSVDLQFLNSREPLWQSCQLFVIYRRGPSRIRVAAVL